ncbi:MAG: PqiC family protein [Opitutaceae bacterium]
MPSHVEFARNDAPWEPKGDLRAPAGLVSWKNALGERVPSRSDCLGGWVGVWLLVSALGFLASGCSLTEAQADPTRFFVLSTNAVRAQPTVAADAPRLRLRQVELANYIRARPIIVRRGDNEVEFRDFARWGEPLEQGIGRVLREELLSRGAVGAVIVPGLRGGNSAYDYDLTVRVLACEGAAGGTVIFRAGWTLAAAGESPAVVARGDFQASGLTWDGKSEGNLVGQLSQAVANLGSEFAAALPKK